MCDLGQRSGVPSDAPSSYRDAFDMVATGLAWLAGEDAVAVPCAGLADGLREFERVESLLVAGRAAVLSAFERRRGFEADGAGSARSWLRWQAKVTSGAAAGSVGWMRRLREHRLVAEALASAAVSVSWARQICAWTELLPAGRRGDADEIMLRAVADGADLADLAVIAEELQARVAEPDADQDPGAGSGPGAGSEPGSDGDCGAAGGSGAAGGGGLGGRDGLGGLGRPDGSDPLRDGKLWLAVTMGGAGRLEADLSPGCAAALRAVLDSLGKKAGPLDTRTMPERQHDALYEALRRLIAAGGLPDRAGQPVQIQLHISVEELLRRRGAWPGGGPAGGGQGGTLSPVPGWPLAASGEECDAALVPIVTGALDHDLLDRLVLAVKQAGGAGGGTVNSDTVRDLIIANAAALFSGPRGLASWLRRRELAGIAGSVSLPLDTGTSTETIPGHLRRAVILRDQCCAAPGCDTPPGGCQVHHVRPRSQGGRTKLTNLLLLCTFHHLIMVHRWGWSITLNPDGTTTMASPDGRIYHSHSPPAPAAA